MRIAEAPRRFGGVAIHGLLMLATAFLFQTLTLQLGNTLHRNGRWMSSKVALEYGVPGAVSFLTTRTALHRNRLNLGVWHKYQEVLYREPVALGAIELDFRIRRSGYLVVLFNRDEVSFSGVRLSRNPDFPSTCLSGTIQGEFTGRTPLEVGPLDKEWHRLSLKRGESSYAVSIDGRSVGVCGSPLPGLRHVGLRGSAASRLYVDNVVIRETGSGRLFEETFENRAHAFPIFWIALTIVLAIHLVVLLRSRRRTDKRTSLYLATTHLVLLAIGGILLVGDTLYFGRLHPSHVRFHGYPKRLEREPQVRERLREEYPRTKPRSVRRILFIGASQTWGSGAAESDDTWVRQLEAKLNAEAPAETRYECIGGAIPGSKSRKLYDLYASEWVELEPEAVVINLGLNERDLTQFELDLKRFVEINRSRGIRTVLVPEPTTTENRSSLQKINPTHEVVRRVSRAMDVPVIELHDYLRANRDRGFIWWDRAHLTSFGQGLVAERLFEERATLLGRDGRLRDAIPVRDPG
jgi:lysophospholipase L1-like esterase